ncbi:non-canonical purine NTP phosphatase [Aliivibrio finisterrensis]|uniref:inosine/xanthosine triphosphatase n=1 Tax=Aliivibrio finisterrensis TaxID=511998 RepID=UPI001020FC60|nr:inosine/xanthosine triphosphatase [Aliivibrio finisterrensis]RYU68325.1 non-canonical purine NTP phosphatase [Aliivibrio finisterrensis]RYU68972.1 non-canonical purine NTP phosphatase [Aliivibrio finisterrensis]RYU71800.1 non-canonical purine NTP phosphatase [Aliivibrio finisterrensis]
MDVIISSLNPAKISAVEAAFNQVFPDSVFNFIGVSVDSGVPDQPMSCIDTKQGAINRVNNAKIQHPNAEYYVGLEAGIEGNSTFAWMIIDNTKQVGESRSSSLPLPPAVITAVNQGKELGDVMDEQFNTDNIKQKGGAIGLLTNNLLTRSSVYQQALILALIPFLHPERFFEVTP